MLVIDASAMVDVLSHADGSEAIEDRLRAEAGTFHAPHLIDAEVLHVLRRRTAMGHLSHRLAQEALDDWLDFPIERYAHFPFAPRAWELRANLTAYDALYVTLAEWLEAPLITRDARLAKAPGLKTRVEVY